jgi:hypothetical protein
VQKDSHRIISHLNAMASEYYTMVGDTHLVQLYFVNSIPFANSKFSFLSLKLLLPLHACGPVLTPSAEK